MERQVRKKDPKDFPGVLTRKIGVKNLKTAVDILWKQLEEEAGRLEERVGDLVMEDPSEEKDPEELYEELIAKINDREENAISEQKRKFL